MIYYSRELLRKVLSYYSVNKINRSLLQIREHLGIEVPNDHQLREDIVELIKGKKKIEAVKKYRQQTNEGLKEAYD